MRNEGDKRKEKQRGRGAEIVVGTNERERRVRREKGEQRLVGSNE